jgi:hypothetical protein
LNTVGLLAASASVSAAAGATADAVGVLAVGGRSNPPFRPQAPNANAAALTTTTAHPNLGLT